MWGEEGKEERKMNVQETVLHCKDLADFLPLSLVNTANLCHLK